MLKSIPKLLSAASIVLFSCGPMHDTGSVLLNDEEYASTRQAIESENTDELIGSYTKRDLFIPHQTGVRLVKGGGLSCEVALGYRADCTGAVLNAQDEDGALQLRVDSRSGGLYRVSYRRGTSGDFTALCRSTIDKPAIVIPGSWNKNADRLLPIPFTGFTFACEGSAAYKCSREHQFDPLDNKSHHQACTRMLRADYCGSGISNTEKGTRIDIEDSLGRYSFWTHPSWPFEATWGENGAVCVDKDRLTLGSVNLASCIYTKSMATCDSMPFSATVLFKTRVDMHVRPPGCPVCPPGKSCPPGENFCWPIGAPLP